MSSLELLAQEARNQIRQMLELIDEQERHLRMLQTVVGHIGLETAEGRQVSAALEEEIRAKERTLRALRRFLDVELRRLQELEDALALRPRR